MKPANSLDEYHAALIAQRARLHPYDSDACKARLPPAHKLPGDVLGRSLSQFEVVAELSLELISVPLQNTAHTPNLIEHNSSLFVSYPLSLVGEDPHLLASSQGLITFSPLTKGFRFNETVSGGVDIPGVISEISCGIDQQAWLAGASKTSPQHTAPNIQPKISNQIDQCEFVRTTIGQSASSAMSVGTVQSPRGMIQSRPG